MQTMAEQMAQRLQERNRIPLIDYLKKVHPDCKNAVIKRLNLIMTHIKTGDIPEKPDMDFALRHRSHPRYAERNL
jgi:hypothetical protein